MGFPGVQQLPLAILQIPNFHAVISGGCDDPIAVEIEFGDSDDIPVASIEIGKPTRHLWVLHCTHWVQLLCLD